MELSRREFLFLGVASGTAVAVGIIVPLSIASREFVPGGETPIPDGAVSGDAAALVGFFPRTKVAQLSGLRESEPLFFDYPLVGQTNALVKLGQPALGGVGPDEDIVAFSRICTHMGCVLEDYRPDHRALGPCPCHFSTFDLAHGGMVTLGQATQNLPQVLLTVDGEDVYATGVVRLVYGFANTLEGAELVAATS